MEGNMDIYKGNAFGMISHEELLDFLNYVFGMDGSNESFDKLLPKLYYPEYEPTKYNYIAIENGRLRGAVGAYPWPMYAGDEKLSVIGIGNVAAHPYYKGKGYMKECMKLALQSIIDAGADYSVLGGRRQRYEYFGFEPAGVCGKFSVNKANLRHYWGSENNKTGYVALGVTKDSKEMLEYICKASRSLPAFALRDVDSLFDVASSWHSKIFVVMRPHSMNPCGYFIVHNTDITEISVENIVDFEGVMYSLFEKVDAWEINIRVPSYDVCLYDELSELAERVELIQTEMFNVFNYERVIRAYIKTKAECENLGDGELTMSIKGFTKDEKIKISVKNGVPTVTSFDGACEFEFEHLDAMQVLFSLHSKERKKMSAAVRTWLPLPLYVSEIDNV